MSIGQRLSMQTNETLVLYKPSYLVASLHLKIVSVATGVFFTNRWQMLLPVLLVHFVYELRAGAWCCSLSPRAPTLRHV